MKLKELRKNKKLRQEDIAKFLNVGTSTYGGYENETSEPTIETLKKLAKFYNVSVDYLIDMKEESNDEESKEIYNIVKQLKPIAKGKVLGYAKAQLEQQNNNNKKTNIEYIDW